MIHTSRSRRRRRTRRAIVDAAFALVAEGGLSALTMHALADAVDYTPGALYRYFDSRDHLVAALQLDVIATWTEALDALLTRCQESPLVGILAVGALFRELAAAHPARFGLISSMLGDPRRLVSDDAAAPVVLAVGGLLARVTGLIAAALGPEGAEERALMLTGGLQGVLQLRKLESLAPTGLRVDPIARELVPTLLLGWGASEAQVASAREGLDVLIADAPLLGGP